MPGDRDVAWYRLTSSYQNGRAGGRGSYDGFWQDVERGNPELFGMAKGLNPTGRMGTPEEMAKAVVFLSSPVSSFTTGTNLVVDGALTRGLQL